MTRTSESAFRREEFKDGKRRLIDDSTPESLDDGLDVPIGRGESVSIVSTKSVLERPTRQESPPSRRPKKGWLIDFPRDSTFGRPQLIPLGYLHLLTHLPPPSFRLES